MTKTKSDICTLALVMLNVTPIGGEPEGEDMTLAQSVLESFFARFTSTDGAVLTWDLGATPEEAYLPLANILAAMLAPMFQRQSPISLTRGIGQLRELAFPNDVTDSRDLDDNGVIGDAEEQAGLEAQFY